MATSASGRPRRFLVGLFLVLALLSAVAATVALWARAYVVDTDRWVETVGPLIEEPEVVVAVGRLGARAIVEGLDLEELIRRSPEAVGSLAVDPGASPEALSAAVRHRLARGIEAALDTDLARRLWAGINRAAHRSALALVRGEAREGVELTEGTVSLSLVPLIQLALDGTEDLLSDVFGRPIDVPRPDAASGADAARARIETALDVDLSEDFGEVVVLSSDRLLSLQEAVAALDRMVLWIVALAVVLAVATVLLSTDRPRTLLALGVGMVIAFVAAGLAVRVLERVLADLASEENRDAARQVVAAVFASLLSATTVMAVAGFVVGILAYLAGRPARLGRTRT